MKSDDYESFYKVSRLTPTELERLKTLVKAVNCESIALYHNKSIHLRYDGHRLYGYYYIINNNTVPSIYTYKNINHVDTNVYTGLYENQIMLCNTSPYISKK